MKKVKTEALREFLKEAEVARKRVLEGLLEELRETPPWRILKVAAIHVALKQVEGYHLHFRILVNEGRLADDELAAIHEAPEWARIQWWRKHGRGS